MQQDVPPWEYLPGEASRPLVPAQRTGVGLVPPWEYEPGTEPASVHRVQQDVPPWEHMPGEAIAAVRGWR